MLLMRSNMSRSSSTELWNGGSPVAASGLRRRPTEPHGRWPGVPAPAPGPTRRAEGRGAAPSRRGSARACEPTAVGRVAAAMVVEALIGSVRGAREIWAPLRCRSWASRVRAVKISGPGIVKEMNGRFLSQVERRSALFAIHLFLANNVPRPAVLDRRMHPPFALLSGGGSPFGGFGRPRGSDKGPGEGSTVDPRSIVTGGTKTPSAPAATPEPPPRRHPPVPTTARCSISSDSDREAWTSSSPARP